MKTIEAVAVHGNQIVGRPNRQTSLAIIVAPKAFWENHSKM
jgi:hypothetical protein